MIEIKIVLITIIFQLSGIVSANQRIFSFVTEYSNNFRYNSVIIYFVKDNERILSISEKMKFAKALKTSFKFVKLNEDRSGARYSQSDLDFYDRKDSDVTLEDVKLCGPGKALLVAFMRNFKDLKLLQQFSDNDSFRHCDWLIFGDPKSKWLHEGSHDYLPYFPLDNKVTFAVLSKAQSKFGSTALSWAELYEVYQAASFLPYRVNYVGRWGYISGFKLNGKEVHAQRTNLTGLHFRCTTMDQKPFTYVKSTTSSYDVTIESGLVIDIWKSLQEIFNFTYTCRMPRDNQWGVLRGKQWTGMVRDLTDNIADVVVAPLDFNAERAGAVDFTLGFRTISYRMIVRRPQLMESTWTSFTDELGDRSWIVTGVMILLTPFILAFASNTSPIEKFRLDYSEAYVVSLGALFYQGSWIKVSSVSTRVVFITIFLSTLLIYAHYTSALVAQLTVASERSTPFNDLQGFSDYGSYELGFLKGISLEESFKNSRSSPFKEIWQKIKDKKQNFPSQNSVGLEKVAEESYIYMMEANMFKFEFNHVCEAVMLPKNYFLTTTGLAFKKNSPYVKTFNYYINTFREAGLLDGFWKRYEGTGSSCYSAAYVPLAIEQLFTAFLVLIFGMGVALVLCLPLEKIIRSVKVSSSTEVFEYRPHLDPRRKGLKFYSG